MGGSCGESDIEVAHWTEDILEILNVPFQSRPRVERLWQPFAQLWQTCLWRNSWVYEDVVSGAAVQMEARR